MRIAQRTHTTSRNSAIFVLLLACQVEGWPLPTFNFRLSSFLLFRLIPLFVSFLLNLGDAISLHILHLVWGSHAHSTISAGGGEEGGFGVGLWEMNLPKSVVIPMPPNRLISFCWCCCACSAWRRCRATAIPTGIAPVRTKKKTIFFHEI